MDGNGKNGIKRRTGKQTSIDLQGFPHIKIQIMTFVFIFDGGKRGTGDRIIDG
jgi:hypothetical protein